LGVRYLELQNVWITLNNPIYYIFGKGLGAEWAEIIPIASNYREILRPNIYPTDEYLRMHTHSCLITILLKMGIMGVIIYVWIFFKIFRHGMNLFNSLKNRYYKSITLALAISTILFAYFIIQDYQNDIFLGVSIGLLGTIERLKNLNVIL
jgi:O-antigen ligase